MKNKIWLTPLMALPFVLNCGNMAQNKINSQEELGNALKFVDIQFAQCNFDDKGNCLYEFSPTVFHALAEADDEEDYDYYCEKNLDDNKYYSYELMNGVWTKKEVDQDKFMVPQQMFKQFHFDGLIDKINFEQFAYKDGCYTISQDDITLTMRFSNKRIMNLQIFNQGEELSSYNFTYKKMTPSLPEVKDKKE